SGRPNNKNPRIHETPPPCGQTLRLRRRPRFETTPGNQPSIHPDPPEFTDSTPSPPQTSSTQVKPKAERINRLFEISSIAIHYNHREEGFTLHLSGTGTGVDGARGTSASRRQNQIAEQGTSLRLPQHDRAFTPETDSPHAALFQSSGKAEERGDESKAKIEGCNGSLRSSGDGTHAHAPAGHRTRL
ncbi:hypothetical protein IGI04_035698, partial [Brassica rapa subsp. trilocularis]